MIFAGLVPILSKFGLGWVFGPMGKVLGIAAAALFAVTMIRSDAKSDCRADQLEATIEQMEADRERAEGIADRAAQRALAAETRAAELERLTNEVINTDRDLTDPCHVSDELRERLRAIR